MRSGRIGRYQYKIRAPRRKTTTRALARGQPRAASVVAVSSGQGEAAGRHVALGTHQAHPDRLAEQVSLVSIREVYQAVTEAVTEKL